MKGTLSRYYGGRTLEEVAATVAALGERGVGACVSALPRFRVGRAGLEEERRKILAVLPFLKMRGLSADLTVKLSQLGQRWLPRDCAAALDGIAASCAEHGAFLWVDMEQSGLVDATLEAFEEVAQRRDNVGICLQTYLRRTEADAERLLARGWPLRLVKGYYRERPPQAWRTWAETTDCFRRLLLPLVRRSRRPAIGTHDEGLIAAARALRVPAARLEYQFFLGAKPSLAPALAAEGLSVRVYIPFGAMLPYLLHSLPYMDMGRNLQRLLGVRAIR